MKRMIEPVRTGTLLLLGLSLNTLASFSARACGPNLPNSLFDGTDSQILRAPIADFAVHIQTVDLPLPPFSANPSAPGQQAADSRTAELSDLKKALEMSGLPEEQARSIAAAHATERARVVDYVTAYRVWEKNYGWIPNNAVPPPSFPAVQIANGLPVEFAEYFTGALAWHAGDPEMARAAWSVVLELPESQRHFKSTWAAYMLGRSWEDARPALARKYYRKVRAYFDNGMADSAGLAAASLGREALTYYRGGDPKAAIKLYMEQYATGDPSALNSLRFAAVNAIWEHPNTLRSLAQDPISRRVITGYLVSRGYTTHNVHLDGLIRETAINTLARIKYLQSASSKWHRYEQASSLWLNAVEHADIESTEDAGLLALRPIKLLNSISQHVG